MNLPGGGVKATMQDGTEVTTVRVRVRVRVLGDGVSLAELGRGL